LPGDCIILASDGLETLSSRTIADILMRTTGMSSLAIVKRLLKATRAARNRRQDNTTIIVHRVAAAESHPVGEAAKPPQYP
jgi:serine/threonine protein phosphatase PrpC